MNTMGLTRKFRRISSSQKTCAPSETWEEIESTFKGLICHTALGSSFLVKRLGFERIQLCLFATKFKNGIVRGRSNFYVVINMGCTDENAKLIMSCFKEVIYIKKSNFKLFEFRYINKSYYIAEIDSSAIFKWDKFDNAEVIACIYNFYTKELSRIFEKK